MGIQNLEFSLLGQLPTYWDSMVAAIGTSTDLIPLIFDGLPSTGAYGYNQAAIAALFQQMTSGKSADNLTFLLQYPTMNAHVPCVSIEVQDEQENEVIGGFVYENEIGGLVDYIGGPFDKKYSIGIWSWLPDTTLYIFSFIKYFLLDIRSTYQAAANFRITIRPMQVDANRFEEPVYFRYIDIVLEAVLDTVERSYATVTQVIVNPTEVYSSVTVTETVDGNIIEN